ncbi:hypothetical protein [Ascidiaceihabitans sp.]|uniref:hypothetical protein n=1 Tax=Ascidiaceihabitans sp. TaxID=1872644 RepID=UPI003299AFA2
MKTRNDARFFESLMQDRAQDLYDQLTKGKSTRDIMEMEDELEEKTFMPRLLAEVARGLPEARAMIDALDQSSSAPVDLIWVKVYPGYEYGQLGRARRTHQDIISRLKDISFLDFGEDADAWREWLEAFENEPPLTGYR